MPVHRVQQLTRRRGSCPLAERRHSELSEDLGRRSSPPARNLCVARSVLNAPHMQRNHVTTPLRSASIAALMLSCFMAVSHAQTSETIVGVAARTPKDGKNLSVPVTIVINHMATAEERDAVVRAAKTGGSEAVRALLSTRDAVGTLQLGERSTPVKYAYVRATGSGRLITAITSERILVSATDGPQSRPATIGFALIELPDTEPGHGELMLGAKVRVNEWDAIVTDTYDPDDVMMLSNIGRK
jgi:hypothetical protein